MESLRELYRIGPGPSSSHSLGVRNGCKYYMNKYPDYEKYRAERGLNEVFEQCPFPRAYSSEQLQEVIGTFSEEKYWADMAAFREKWQPYDDGHAAQTIVAWMKQKMQEG